MKTIYFITGNAHKAAELSQLLSYPVHHITLDLPEIQSLDLKEIALFKAKMAWDHVQDGYVLVEDTSLRFHAFDKLPGPFIKWFYKKLHNEGLIKLLHGFIDRRASAEICYCLYDGQEPVYFEARTGGRISEEPRGGQGFGWDAIFIPNGSTLTWGEMTAEEKHATSMRHQAIQNLRTYLAENLKS